MSEHFKDVYVGDHRGLKRCRGVAEGKRLHNVEADHLAGIRGWQMFAISAVTQDDTARPAEVL